MNPETSHATPIEVTVESSDERIVNVRKADVMAHLEGEMRGDVADLEAAAERNEAIAQTSSDTFYDRTAQGYRNQAEHHQASIDEMTRIVGDNFDKITLLNEEIRGLASDKETTQAEKEREVMEQKIGAAALRFGHAGTDQTPDPYLNADRYAEDADVLAAQVHARRSHN